MITHTHTVTIFLFSHRVGKNWCYIVKGKERRVFLYGTKIVFYEQTFVNPRI